MFSNYISILKIGNHSSVFVKNSIGVFLDYNMKFAIFILFAVFCVYGTESANAFLCDYESCYYEQFKFKFI